MVNVGIIIITVILFTRILMGKIFRQLQHKVYAKLKSHHNSAEGLNDSFDSYVTVLQTLRLAALLLWLLPD